MNVLQSTKPQPSAPRVIWTDFIAFFTALMPVIMWVIFIVLATVGPIPDMRWGRDPLTHAPIYLPTVFTLVAIPVLVWRVSGTRRLFADGIEVPGSITDVSFFRDRGYVKFTYRYLDVTYNGRSAIMETGPAKALRPGDQVTVVLRRENPKRAAVRELYL
jgi:hypothetical protein